MSGGTATEAARRVAAEIVRTVLRWDGGEGPRESSEPAAGSRVESVATCAGRIARATGLVASTARAFGGEWPVVEEEGWLVAPALPLFLTAAGGDGPDAGYRLCDGEVWREAAGVESLLLTTKTVEEDPGGPFDLLWFGDSERYTVRHGMLEVEDLFSHVELPVDHAALERLLVRARRVEAAVLDGLSCHRPDAPAVITVNRAAVLTPAENWRDPERFLRARSDIERTTRQGDLVEAETLSGGKAVFLCEELSDGWTARVVAGDYLLTALSFRRQESALSLSAVLHASVDPLAPGMRGRLAFDLRSDLVALSPD